MSQNQLFRSRFPILGQAPSILEIERIKSSILESYSADFPKYTKYITHKPDVQLLRDLFEKPPHFVGKKITYSKMSANNNAAKINKQIKHLKQALIVKKCIHTSAKKTPLKRALMKKYLS